ncbi:TPA: ComF family protein [Streptococcus agalactiae]|nr:ComF family protein [Streptococcus agalactiae]
MTCLLCHEIDLSQLTFVELMLLKPKQNVICQTCKGSFEALSREMGCQTCCKQIPQKQCQDCIYWGKKGIEVNHFSLYRYNEAMKKYFSLFKFQGDYLLKDVFTKEIKAALKKYKGYTIVPVPLSHEGYQNRQFNQVIAFLQSANNKEERLKQVQRFTLKNEAELGDNLLIVDDIYTTGATIAQIRKLLEEKGIKNIKSFSLAR